MRHTCKFPNRKATNNMVAHARDEGITNTPVSAGPEGKRRMLHERHDTSGACHMHQSDHSTQKRIGQ
eukprot:5218749-Karenia_brevis.AAC.1